MVPSRNGIVRSVEHARTVLHRDVACSAVPTPSPNDASWALHAFRQHYPARFTAAIPPNAFPPMLTFGWNSVQPCLDALPCRYRLMPEIVLKKDFVGEEADDLAACFNPGVIIVEQGGDGVRRARVGDARACTMTREVYRHAHLAPYVELKRIRDHFIFSVESTGAMPAATLVTEAIGMMLDKVELLTLALDQLERDDGDEMEEDAEAEDEA